MSGIDQVLTRRVVQKSTNYCFFYYLFLDNLETATFCVSKQYLTESIAKKKKNKLIIYVSTRLSSHGDYVYLRAVFWSRVVKFFRQTRGNDGHEESAFISEREFRTYNASRKEKKISSPHRVPNSKDYFS